MIIKAVISAGKHDDNKFEVKLSNVNLLSAATVLIGNYINLSGNQYYCWDVKEVKDE